MPPRHRKGNSGRSEPPEVDDSRKQIAEKDLLPGLLARRSRHLLAERQPRLCALGERRCGLADQVGDRGWVRAQ